MQIARGAALVTRFKKPVVNDEPIGAAGKVVNARLAAAADRRGVERDEIGHRPGAEHASVGDRKSVV